MTDLLFANLPLGDLALAFALCLLVSSLGFRRTDWFISLGYGFSIAAQALVFPLLHLPALSAWSVAQALLLLAYGLRLGLYLMARERSPSFARELAASKERSLHIKGAVKVAIWVSVSALYVAMFAPALLTLTAGPAAAASPALPLGVLVMVLGLGLEAAADWQKARFKALNPSRFVDTGLFAIVRCPNYFGEMLFWLGAFVSGIAAYQSLADWVNAGVGLVCIELIMLGSARRLELKQAERYGADATYQAYVRTTPVLFPLLPLYSLRGLKIYLG